ncbi:ROK family protein [Paenibacillus sp. CMAA1364]
MNEYSIAFDVGGLFIKSAISNNEGGIVPNSYAVYPAKSKETKNEIIDHLVNIIKQQANSILDPHFEITGVGYAFPGPFDYDNGISYIKDVDKFEYLYGENVHELIINRLRDEASFSTKLSDRFQIVFGNDASLFALGERLSGKAMHYNRCIFITIGTGAGSAFMNNGELVTDQEDVPPNGWLYNQEFGDSIVDDYISKRGIINLARDLGIHMVDDEVKTLADMARAEDPKAILLFQTFGRTIGKALNRNIQIFKPDAIIFGGQITKCHDLFIDGIRETLHNKTLPLEFSSDTSLSTFKGASVLLQHKDHERWESID